MTSKADKRPTLSHYFRYFIIRNIVFYSRLLTYFAMRPGQVRLVRFAGENLPITEIRKDSLPWITFGAICWLEGWIGSGKIALEYGSGRSTIYLCQRTAKLISVESDTEWYEAVRSALKRLGLNNCDHLLTPLSPPGAYSGSISQFPDGSFDLVLIDGVERNDCIKLAMPRIKLGGAIVLDNSDRHEYGEGIALLKEWRRMDFFGPGPYNKNFWQTSVFLKTNKA